MKSREKQPTGTFEKHLKQWQKST